MVPCPVPAQVHSGQGATMKQLRILLCSALIFSASATTAVLAQEPSLTNRATELRAAPDDSATVVKQLSERTQVQVQERKGAWSRVKVDNETGWVRMMHLRGGATIVTEEKSASGGFFAGFSRLLGGGNRGNQRAQSATVGIRGFSKEDIARADFNPAEFEKLKRYQASESQARTLASQGRLAFRSVAYLSQDAIDSANARGAKK
jgi:hypothetical protein